MSVRQFGRVLSLALLVQLAMPMANYVSIAQAAGASAAIELVNSDAISTKLSLLARNNPASFGKLATKLGVGTSGKTTNEITIDIMQRMRKGVSARTGKAIANMLGLDSPIAFRIKGGANDGKVVYDVADANGAGTQAGGTDLVSGQMGTQAGKGKWKLGRTQTEEESRPTTQPGGTEPAPQQAQAESVVGKKALVSLSSRAKFPQNLFNRFQSLVKQKPAVANLVIGEGAATNGCKVWSDRASENLALTWSNAISTSGEVRAIAKSIVTSLANLTKVPRKTAQVNGCSLGTHCDAFGKPVTSALCNTSVAL